MFLQKISIVKIDSGTLEGIPQLTVRAYASDEGAWDLGHQLWDTWLRRNPGVMTRLVVGRRTSTLDD